MRKIVIAGGCFWGVEAYFKALKGVIDTEVGYANGNFPNPTYEQVCSGIATHVEALALIYDEEALPLTKILEHLFRIIDPTSLNKQGGDIGIQYRTGVYYTNLEDFDVVTDFIKNAQESYKKPIVVEVEPLKSFDLAEIYHQDYLDKNPKGYCHVDLNLITAEEKK